MPGQMSITTGNHVWDQRDAMVYCDRQPAFLRPINFPAGVPGKGANLYHARNGASVLVMNAMGRVYMDALDCPFRAVDKALSDCPMGDFADVIILDFHAEATSEKQAMGYFCDGRASMVVGTHTHTPTSDHRILPAGTAYLTDAGMCGDYDSVLGMDKGRTDPSFPAQGFIFSLYPSPGGSNIVRFCCRYR